MRRLRFVAALDSTIENEFGPAAEARRQRVRQLQTEDPTLLFWFMAAFAGPDALPASAFEPTVRERLLAAS